MFNDSYKADYSNRDTSLPVDSMFTKRWSPRAFKKTKLDSEIIETLGEAARWSPSSYNTQPWRIILAENGSDDFNTYLSVLVEFNQMWAKNASLLGFFVTSLNFEEGRSNNTIAAFDTGFAWAAFTFQARKLGLYTHGMSGLDYEAAYKVLSLDKKHHIIISAFAVGVLDEKTTLPEELQKREIPSGERLPLNKILFNGVPSNIE